MRTISTRGRGLFAAIRRRAVTYNPHVVVEELMTTIWGRLERIAEDPPDYRWVQVRAIVPGSGAILARIIIGEQTLITRGIEQVTLSNLREGEPVEVTFRSARTGLVKAETIDAQTEPVMSASICPFSVSPQMSSQSSILQATGDPESVCGLSD